ncbi:MAG TPA: S41 family peptidase [Vicinamibacterales bacterium]|nr:S41 family peptidase [Vicinamibacterales bacterium]
MAEVEVGKRLELLEIANSPRARTSAKDLGDFLYSAERKAQLSRRDRLLIVEQALLLMEMNYVHLPMKRAIHAIDPIQQLKMLRFQLAEWNEGLESTIEFHRRMLSIFGSTRDLHTLYLLPEPYKDCTAYLPFLIELCFERDGPRFIVTRTASSGDALAECDDGREARFERGVEVLGWNGVPIFRAIELNGELQAGSNADARFARGLDNLTIRPLNSSVPPDEHWVDILYRAKNGVVASHREYWLVHKTGDADESSTPHSRKRAAMDLKRTRILEVKKTLYPRDDSATLGSIKDVLYAVKKTVNGQALGYIRIFSFDVDDARRFVKAFTRLITKPGFPQDGLILDVRGNPGGNIRAAESLLQLFTPHRIEPELFEFINTPLNFQICKSAPDRWDLKRWLPSIGESVLTGATYSAGFPLTLEPLCNGIGQVYYGPVVLITDALSYSATDIFAAGFQDNEVGLVLSTGGNTGAGGANFWSLDDLLRAQKKDPKSPFKTLPKGAEMIVAMRRSIRVGPRAGAPLEEFGVAPDKLHLMTRRDILEDNCDLLATAAQLIRQRPSFTLSVTPVTRKGARGIAVSAASKRPSPKAGQGISRVDIYVNNRPVRSIDARGGVVPSTQVTIGKAGNKPAIVEAHAWDHSGRLVAYRRTTIR